LTHSLELFAVFDQVEVPVGESVPVAEVCPFEQSE
jgi:hypothetical protein